MNNLIQNKAVSIRLLEISLLFLRSVMQDVNENPFYNRTSIVVKRSTTTTTTTTRVPFLCSRTVRCMNVLFRNDTRQEKRERDENYLLNLLEIERVRENERE